MVSIIIPAYNEEKTIGVLIRSIIKHPDVTEIIVVDDGSIDATGKAASAEGARVLRLNENKGKAEAMDVGVKASTGSLVLFLDADVTGFTHEKISTIIDPVLDGSLEMHVGILPRPSLGIFGKKVFYVLPVLSGMRALTKTLWYKVPRSYRDGFKIELALNHAARKWGKGTGYEIIPGLSHITKEEKYGFLKGSRSRIKMMAEIVYITFRLYILG
jgi:glycosyltransferase involved in cell wall biosynthesis